MPQVTNDDITIEYDVRGQGDPILFVMGLGGQLVDWPVEFVDLFVELGYQVIRFDNRDIGLSTQTDWTPPSESKALGALLARRPLKGVGYTVTDMAEDAIAVLDDLGHERAHIVGLSMGGMIVQEMAINHPDRVRSMCSIMSNTGDRKNGMIAMSLARRFARRPAPTLETAVDMGVEVFQAIAGPTFDPEEHRVRTKESVERAFTPQGVARQTAAIAGSRDRTPLLSNVTAPTLVIHGIVDPLVKFSGGVATAKAVPGARLLAFPDMGHDLPRPRWDEIRDAIVENINRSN